MNNSTEHLRRILDQLFTQNQQNFAPENITPHKVCISTSTGAARAVSHWGVGASLDAAYAKAREKAVRHALAQGQIPRWIYLGFVEQETRLSLADLCAELARTKKYYYRRGVALDPQYKIAFLEQELNASSLIRYGEEGAIPTLHEGNITAFLRRQRNKGKDYRWQPGDLGEVITFRCKASVYDGDFHALHGTGLEAGIRRVDRLDRAEYLELIRRTGAYLAGTVREDGSFVYGYFPAFDRQVPSYNAIRHCLSVMALLELYELTGEALYRDAAKRTYAHFMGRYLVELTPQTAVTVDWEYDREIRLGGLGLAVIAILHYARLFGTDRDLPKAIRLGNAMVEMQDGKTGRFTHVLRYPDLSVKDEFRIVYYSGEACYGLMQLYQKTRDARYLQAVERAFDFFIAEKYETYFDHWLSYAANELTAVKPEDRYFSFGLRNAFHRIDYILRRITTWPTFLELLNAAFQMTERIRALDKGYLLEPFDLEKLYRALRVRAERQRGGVLYPEQTMFFKSPDKMLYGTFIRHHFFRVRNDDVAHHLIGYCHFVQNVLDSGRLDDDANGREQQ